jgi:hypothetical protein
MAWQWHPPPLEDDWPHNRTRLLHHHPPDHHACCLVKVMNSHSHRRSPVPSKAGRG